MLLCAQPAQAAGRGSALPGAVCAPRDRVRPLFPVCSPDDRLRNSACQEPLARNKAERCDVDRKTRRLTVRGMKTLARGGITMYELARIMGTSVGMIEPKATSG